MIVSYISHALERIAERGTSKTEVEAAIRGGKRLPDQLGRIRFEHVFPFNNQYKGTYFKNKEVIVTAELIDKKKNHWKVITVLTKFY